jgi:SulP family sulfate permease
MLTSLKQVPLFFFQPVRLFRTYGRGNLRPDLIAGITVAVVLLPQAIAFALIAELPPEMGLYAAIVAATVGALWGSCNQIHTGPTNAFSLLVLSTLLLVAEPGTSAFLVAAGLMAVMVGVFQVVLGLARLGLLANFVSHSVILGFASGAGILIAIQQMRPLLGLEFSSHNLLETVRGMVTYLPDVHIPTAALGVGTMVLIVLLQKINPKLPGPLVGMVVASAVVALLGLDNGGVQTIGKLPSSLPPLAHLPFLDLDLIAKLATGALAVGSIGLVQTTASARSIATQTGQRLDSNQEFVGQGLANIAAGLFSGYAVAASFSRSTVNLRAGARTPLSAIFSSLFVLVAMFTLAPLTAYLPRAALSGVLILTTYNMIDRKEIARIWRGARSDAVIMVVTFLGTLFLELEFAVLAGILLSFAFYIMKTSTPQVSSMLPDQNFRHFIHQPHEAQCPQLAVLDIRGDLYFGAVSHVEKAIDHHLAANPGQRFLLLRMHSVAQCDFSGIHALESIVHTCRERGGDVFMVRVQDPVLDQIKSAGFYDSLGGDHFLSEDEAVSYLFRKVIDPAICIYECDVRAFKECQNLPRPAYPVHLPCHTDIPTGSVGIPHGISARELWQQLCDGAPPLIIDVREPREFVRGHVPQAQLTPLPQLLAETSQLPRDRPIVLVCRGGRRSMRAAHMLRSRGYDNVAVLRGGMLAWETANLLEAVDEFE